MVVPGTASLVAVPGITIRHSSGRRSRLILLSSLALLDQLFDLLSALPANLFIELRAVALRGDFATLTPGFANRHPTAFFRGGFFLCWHPLFSSHNDPDVGSGLVNPGCSRRRSTRSFGPVRSLGSYPCAAVPKPYK